MTEAEARQIIAEIPNHAEKHREVARSVFKIDLNYSAESISRLDEMIKEGWPDGPPTFLDEVVTGFGSYLGETIRRIHGGEWRFNEEDGLHFAVGGMKIWPFAKVKKRFVNGEEDSLGFYYSVIRQKFQEGQDVPPVILTPPPIPKQKKKGWGWGIRIVALVVLTFVGFLGYRVVQFARYLREHPYTAHAQPGELEFREANKKIIASNGSGSFGNSQEAIDLAKDYSKSLKILRDNFFTQGGDTALGSMEGEFLTFCQLNDDSCVFLVHVPELRQFTGDAKESLARLAWINAQAVIQTSHRPPPKIVVVGVKGLMFYDSIMIGDFVANPVANKDGIKRRGSGFEDMKLFYPFFAPKSTATNLASTSHGLSEVLATSGTNNVDITIQSAEFGTAKKVADVTERVTELLRARPGGFLVDAQELGSDPVPGKKKHLTIHYSYHGSTNVFTIKAGKQMSQQSLVERANK